MVYTVGGVTGSVKHLAKHFGIVSHETSRWRLLNGMSPEDAFLTPPEPRAERGRKSMLARLESGTHPRHKHATHNGVTASIKELINRFAVVSEHAVRRRLGLGWNLSDALTKEKTR